MVGSVIVDAELVTHGSNVNLFTSLLPRDQRLFHVMKHKYEKSDVNISIKLPHLLDLMQFNEATYISIVYRIERKSCTER